MSFGELSPDPVERADGFMIGGSIMAPPLMWNRVKTLLLESSHQELGSLLPFSLLHVRSTYLGGEIGTPSS